MRILASWYTTMPTWIRHFLLSKLHLEHIADLLM